MSDYAVEPINDGISEFNVEFHGPKESKFITLFPANATSLIQDLSNYLQISLFLSRCLLGYLFKT